MQRVARFFVVFWMLCLVGCGVGEYNELLQRTQNRLKYMDAENEHLAGPIRLPDAGAGIFFRPPKGIALEPDGKPAQGSAVVYRFPWTESSRIPPFELLIALRVGGGSLEDQLRDYFTLKTGVAPQPAGDQTYTNEADSPDRPPSTTYRCSSVLSTEVPPGPMGTVPLQEACVYKYDIYMHEPSGVAIIFKQLDVTLTRDRWKVLPPADQQPLAAFDDAKLKQKLDKLGPQGEQRKYSLASLGGRAGKR